MKSTTSFIGATIAFIASWVLLICMHFIEGTAEYILAVIGYWGVIATGWVFLILGFIKYLKGR